MSSKTPEERQLITERARKQLAEGTWGEVTTIFGYPTPRAPRTPDEEFERLRLFYEQAGYPNLAKFVEVVRFEEKQRDFSMSYNLSMRSRQSANVMELIMTPDIMVGTRGGLEGAAVWLKNLSEAIPEAIPETVQIFDKIFGEALAFFAQPGQPTTLSEIVGIAFGGAEPPPSVPPTKQ